MSGARLSGTVWQGSAVPADRDSGVQSSDADAQRSWDHRVARFRAVSRRLATIDDSRVMALAETAAGAPLQWQSRGFNYRLTQTITRCRGIAYADLKAVAGSRRIRNSGVKDRGSRDPQSNAARTAAAASVVVLGATSVERFDFCFDGDEEFSPGLRRSGIVLCGAVRIRSPGDAVSCPNGPSRSGMSRGSVEALGFGSRSTRGPDVGCAH